MTEHVQERQVLTTDELARRWALHPRSISRAVREGTFPVRPIPGIRVHRFALTAVEAAETEGRS